MIGLSTSPLITVYVHAVDRGNERRFGWGAVLVEGNTIRTLSGASRKDREDRLLLTACASAIKSIRRRANVVIVCGDKYVTGWAIPNLIKLHKECYALSSGKFASNIDLLVKLYAATRKHESVTGRVAEGWTDHRAEAAKLAMHAELVAAQHADCPFKPVLQHERH